MSGKWTAEDIPDQSGRVAVVTGRAELLPALRLPAVRRRLWEPSEELTAVSYKLPSPVA
jgi:hypothetical protein